MPLGPTIALGVGLLAPADAGPGTATAQPGPELAPALRSRLDAWKSGGRPPSVDADRAAAYALLADWVAEKGKAGEPAHLVFVCTHNSRRSHMSQLWAAAAARHAGLKHVQSWSGGTEATAFNPRSVRALEGHGFDINSTDKQAPDGMDNVIYETRLGEGIPPIAGFSKVYSDAHNPAAGFAAIMVCSAADASCPFVEGAELRVSVPFIDPKRADGTPDQAAVYAAKSEEIGREMAWMMGQVPR